MLPRLLSLSYWTQRDLPLPHADLVLLVISFVSCAVDTMTLPTTKVFVANNTGNIVLLALAAAGLAPVYPDLVHATRCVASLLSSWLGSYLSGLLHTHYGKKTRLILVLEFLTQSLLTLLCAILIYTRNIDLDTDDVFAVICLLSMTFGSQSVVVKGMGVPAIQAQVVTGAMADLFSDPHLFNLARPNKGRNQRVAFILIFFLGGLCGAFVLRYAGGATVLVLVGAGKAVGAGLLALADEPKPKAVDSAEKGLQKVALGNGGGEGVNGKSILPEQGKV